MGNAEWQFEWRESTVEDLRHFGPPVSRLLVTWTIEALKADPQQETKNIKTLRPNKVAQRELRLRGRYRVLFNIWQDRAAVEIVLVGEKTNNRLLVRGEEWVLDESH
jgi:mRNA-degrading endonuclease RelE of RelBE toxin-antitoxin system